VIDLSKLPDVSEEHPELIGEEEKLFAAHMKAREDAYSEIFGESDPPDQILSPDDPELAMNWPGGGIYAFPPRGKRQGWHYVTHGLAQPFGPDEIAATEGGDRFSGLGIELVIATPDRSEWAPSLLVDFVRYLLFQEDAELIVPGDRIPTSAFRTYTPGSQLTHVIATMSPEYEHDILLPAGRCTLVHLIGVTEDEVAKARSAAGGEGTIALGEALRRLGPGYVTDTSRTCATQDSRFGFAWNDAIASVTS
jgi:Suppressor of fused protein (SUFU)